MVTAVYPVDPQESLCQQRQVQWTVAKYGLHGCRWRQESRDSQASNPLNLAQRACCIS